MAKFRNSFDGGTDGVAVSTANSGGASGDAFSAASAGLAFSNAQSHSSPLSGSFTDSAQGTTVTWNATTDVNVAMRAYFWFTNPNSGGNFHLLGAQTTTDGKAPAVFRITSGNILRVYLDSTTGFAWSPTTTMPTGQWIRAEMLVEQGTDNTNGRLRAGIFAGDSLTPLSESGWVTGLNLGAGVPWPLNRLRFGKGALNSLAAGVYMDDLAVNTGADYTGSWIGPEKSASSPSYRWNGTAYVPLESYRWNGTAYVPIDRSII